MTVSSNASEADLPDMHVSDDLNEVPTATVTPGKPSEDCKNIVDNTLNCPPHIEIGSVSYAVVCKHMREINSKKHQVPWKVNPHTRI